MNILVMGGVHGNERFGIELCASLERDPISDVTPVIADEMASKIGARFIDVELAYLARPDPTSSCYEERRSAELQDIARQYDQVVSFHNTPFPGPEAAYVNPAVAPSTLRTVAFLGLRHVVFEDDELDRNLPHMLSVEVPLVSSTRTDRSESSTHEMVLRWREKLAALARQADVSCLPPAAGPSYYEFARAISPAEARTFGLQRVTYREAFQEVSSEVLQLLGMTAPGYILNWNYGNHDPEHFFGAIARSSELVLATGDC